MRVKHRLPLVVGLIFLAALLRIYHLGSSPLRGDEAFTVRAWAAVPADVIAHLAGVEPHPLGALLGFGLWKQLVGDLEFGMRALPALLNLIGVPALYALARRLLRDDRVGLLAALLWAVNPFELYHAQDARDYAIWSALSVLAMWLLVCACDRQRRLDWALYVLAAVAALYSFFLEAFFVAVAMLYIVIWRRTAWRSGRIALLAIALLLIPWGAQLWALAHSGYKGTLTASANISQIGTSLMPALFVGNVNPTLADLWSTLLMILALSVLILLRRGRQSTGLFLTAYAVIPALLLTLAATRLAVFDPRYVIAATPPLLILAAYGLISLHRGIAYRAPLMAWLIAAIFGLAFVLMPLIAYSEFRKAPDWFGLRDYLQTHVHRNDLVLLSTTDPTTGVIDPAFDYYFRGQSDRNALPRPGIDTPADLTAYVTTSAERYRAIWFIPVGNYAGQIDHLLRDQMQLISDDGVGVGQQLIVREYRSQTLKSGEIEHARIIRAGDLSLRGFSLECSSRALTVILFWQGHTPDTAFVHLIGAINPVSGTPLWTQDDHPPLDAVRDIYHLDLGNVAPGAYTVQIGLYDPTNGQRAALTDPNGGSLGDSAILSALHVTPNGAVCA